MVKPEIESTENIEFTSIIALKLVEKIDEIKEVLPHGEGYESIGNKYRCLASTYVEVDETTTHLDMLPVDARNLIETYGYKVYTHEGENIRASQQYILFPYINNDDETEGLIQINIKQDYHNNTCYYVQRLFGEYPSIKITSDKNGEMKILVNNSASFSSIEEEKALEIINKAMLAPLKRFLLEKKTEAISNATLSETMKNKQKVEDTLKMFN